MILAQACLFLLLLGCFTLFHFFFWNAEQSNLGPHNLIHARPVINRSVIPSLFVKSCFMGTQLCFFFFVYGCFCSAIIDLRSCDRKYIACKEGSISCLVLCGAKFLASALDWGARREAISGSHALYVHFCRRAFHFISTMTLWDICPILQMMILRIKCKWWVWGQKTATCKGLRSHDC